MITTTLTLWCDNCEHWEYLNTQFRPHANKEAKIRGWKRSRIDREKHYCPKCVQSGVALI